VGDDKEFKKQSKDFKATKSCITFADIGGNKKSLMIIKVFLLNSNSSRCHEIQRSAKVHKSTAFGSVEDISP
jgi:hypothetical protein